MVQPWCPSAKCRASKTGEQRLLLCLNCRATRPLRRVQNWQLGYCDLICFIIMIRPHQGDPLYRYAEKYVSKSHLCRTTLLISSSFYWRVRKTEKRCFHNVLLKFIYSHNFVALDFLRQLYFLTIYWKNSDLTIFCVIAIAKLIRACERYAQFHSEPIILLTIHFGSWEEIIYEQTFSSFYSSSEQLLKTGLYKRR